ncbi:hypothetical protein BPAE_0006g01110 [Botrytis paeoniae]|uniref:Uncharacterized protein n=1 Tax=Botrytis paeoniae TaxID=278948 RepID=A0A4Z1G4D6_9HELO|nr:hypothetical protein BPAE_0006g01110 [Botrytis paeoniae]
MPPHPSSNICKNLIIVTRNLGSNPECLRHSKGKCRGAGNPLDAEGNKQCTQQAANSPGGDYSDITQALEGDCGYEGFEWCDG